MSRRRDPRTTGLVYLPWKPTDDCPCGSHTPYGRCCGRQRASPYKRIATYKPSGPRSGHANPRCYMNWTNDCSTTISGEHFIAQTVLSILNPKMLRISGAAWIPPGQTRDLPLKALQANVLCQRHNSAWAPLDAMAGKIFRALREIYDDLGRRTLSRKPIWHLFSGEELELWLLKTILGFFHADVLSKNGERLTATQTIMNDTIRAAYTVGHLPEPCGMYVMKDAKVLAQLGSLEFSSLSEETDQRVVGCRLTMMGLVVTLFTDPHMRNRHLFTVNHSYRPDYLFYRNPRRRHSVVLTWQPRTFRRAVEYTMTDSRVASA
jgi:hypothetical protein